MKKFIALLLSVCMLLTMTAALAETRSFLLGGVTDGEGNILDTDELPVLAFSLDDETMICAFGTEEETVPGTAEIVETDLENKLVVLAVTLEDGTEMTVYYDGENDTMTIADEDEGLIYVLVNVDELTED